MVGLMQNVSAAVVGTTGVVDQVKSIRLSDNFRLSEFVKSDTATRLGIDNTPSDEVIENLKLLTLKVIQPVRDWLNKSVRINSGFRCLPLNRAIGSRDTSQHVTGEAADFESVHISNYELASWIRDNLEFDQLILEFYDPADPHSGWVHCSYKKTGNRNECLTITKGNIKRGLHQ